MAAQKDGFSAEVVGRAFVSQFYEMLHQRPEEVYRFYEVKSTMTRPDSNGSMVTVTSTEGIKDLILSLDCKSYKAEILTADAQASHEDGVIVLVTGCMTGKDNVKRKFTESFFLAPQNNGYFVLNDVFRFVEEASLRAANSVEKIFHKCSPEAPASAVAPVQGTVEFAVSSLEKDTAAGKNEAESPQASVDEKPAVAEKAVPQSSVPEKTVRQSSVPEKAVPQSSVGTSLDVQPVVETFSNGHVPKKSYASLLMNGKVGASSTLMQSPTTVAKPGKPNPAPKSVASPSLLKTATVPVSAAPKPAAVSEASASRNGHVEDKGYSIYIGDLPYNATIELVEREFKKFGCIKSNGIQVRSNKHYCFGFVEFEDASAKESAIETKRVQIGEKLVRIEDKVTDTRVVNGVTYNTGRGGSRNDGYRRNNYSNGRSYFRNDYGKGNGEDSSRGSRNGDGYVYQNGSGRGVPQGGAPN